MAKLRDVLMTLGMLERGEVTQRVETELRQTLKRLYELAGPKGKAKGSVNINLGLTVEGHTVTINATVVSKTPKEQGASTLLFVNEEGDMLTEHPQQIPMFPRDADDRRFGGK